MQFSCQEHVLPLLLPKSETIIDIRGSRMMSTSMDDDDVKGEDNISETKIPPPTAKNSSLGRIASAALLIAGITVGGGFLALPTVVAPNGFVPSATALVAIWLNFSFQSLVVVECLCITKHLLGKNNSSALEGSVTPGIAAAARAAFGPTGKRIVWTLLVVLVEATLVSEISRAGSLFPWYRVGCAVSAISIAGVVFGSSGTATSPPQSSTMSQPDADSPATTLNSILTIIFGAMAILLFVQGIPAVDWSRLTAAGSPNWKSLPRAIPTFLQLLVYGEILPAICKLVNYQEGPIRWAIGIGSIIPLILEVGWVALGVCLVPFSVGSMNVDPVQVLLSSSGPVQTPLFCLALSAILTNIIGSYLALQSSFEDVGLTTEFTTTSTTTVGTGGSLRRRLFSAAACVFQSWALHQSRQLYFSVPLILRGAILSCYYGVWRPQPLHPPNSKRAGAISKHHGLPNPFGRESRYLPVPFLFSMMWHVAIMMWSVNIWKYYAGPSSGSVVSFMGGGLSTLPLLVVVQNDFLRKYDSRYLLNRIGKRRVDREKESLDFKKRRG